MNSPRPYKARQRYEDPHKWPKRVDRMLLLWMRQIALNRTAHHNASIRQAALSKRLTILLLVFTSLITVTTFINIMPSGYDDLELAFKIISACSALTAGAIATAIAKLAPGEKAEQHRGTANQYADLSNQIQIASVMTRQPEHETFLRSITDKFSSIQQNGPSLIKGVVSTADLPNLILLKNARSRKRTAADVEESQHTVDNILEASDQGLYVHDSAGEDEEGIYGSNNDLEISQPDGKKFSEIGRVFMKKKSSYRKRSLTNNKIAIGEDGNRIDVKVKEIHHEDSKRKASSSEPLMAQIQKADLILDMTSEGGLPPGISPLNSSRSSPAEESIERIKAETTKSLDDLMAPRLIHNEELTVISFGHDHLLKLDAKPVPDRSSSETVSPKTLTQSGIRVSMATPEILEKMENRQSSESQTLKTAFIELDMEAAEKKREAERERLARNVIATMKSRVSKRQTDKANAEKKRHLEKEHALRKKLSLSQKREKKLRRKLKASRSLHQLDTEASEIPLRRFEQRLDKAKQTERKQSQGFLGFGEKKPIKTRTEQLDDQQRKRLEELGGRNDPQISFMYHDTSSEY